MLKRISGRIRRKISREIPRKILGRLHKIRTRKTQRITREKKNTRKIEICGRMSERTSGRI